jgi:starvation-inducible DNA-binding protein
VTFCMYSPNRESKFRICRTLQETLFDLVATRLMVKQARWNVIGPSFGSIHVYLDRFSAYLEQEIDGLAEALVALGVPASDQPSEIVANSRIAPLPDGFLLDTQLLDLLADRVGTFLQNNRIRQDLLRAEDMLIVDMLNVISQDVEKRMAYIRTATQLAA